MLLPDAPPRAHTFDGLAEEIVEYALKHARIVTARRGEIITQQGEPATAHLRHPRRLRQDGVHLAGRP